MYYIYMCVWLYLIPSVTWLAGTSQLDTGKSLWGDCPMGKKTAEIYEVGMKSTEIFWKLVV